MVPERHSEIPSRDNRWVRKGHALLIWQRNGPEKMALFVVPDADLKDYQQSTIHAALSQTARNDSCAAKKVQWTTLSNK